MDTTFILTVGRVTSFDDVLQRPAQSIQVNNYSNQWVELPGITQFVPPYWVGATFAAAGTNRAVATFNSPTGVPQAATIAAQTCVVAYMEIAVQPNPGQPITVRAPSTEWRNPKGLAFVTTLTFAGPVAFSADWTYTVPAGRRARIDTSGLIAEIAVSDGSGAGTEIGCLIMFFPLGLSGSHLAHADIILGTVVGARADVALASGKELVSGDVIQGQSGNPRGAGVSLFVHHMVIVTEGDA